VKSRLIKSRKEGIEMKESIGKKKIVYKDGDYTKVVEGNCFTEEPFIRVETENGDVYININAITVIK
jgi:hypothetical protein